jgi:hypothetical protein
MSVFTKSNGYVHILLVDQQKRLNGFFEADNKNQIHKDINFTDCEGYVRPSKMK